jgi:hypothetical protein
MKIWLDVHNLTVPAGDMANEYHMREQIQQELAALMTADTPDGKAAGQSKSDSSSAEIARLIFKAVSQATGK